MGGFSPFRPSKPTTTLISLLMLLLLVRDVMGGLECSGSYEDALQDHRSDRRVCHTSPEKLLQENATWIIDKGTETDSEGCFDRCLRRGLDRISQEEIRIPSESVLALFNSEEAYCYCIMDYAGPPEDCSEVGDHEVQMWDIPLYCAAISSKECQKRSKCEFSFDCCYVRGTVPEHPLWKASRIVLQWVFLVVAIAFVLQVIAYSIFKIRNVRGRGFGVGLTPYGEGQASQQLLLATAEQYTRFFEALPSSPPDGEEGQVICTICLEDLSTPPSTTSDSSGKQNRCISLPACGHRFHLGCICQYAMHEVSKTRVALCPNCRVTIYAADAPADRTSSPPPPPPPPPLPPPPTPPVPAHPLRPASRSLTPPSLLS